MICIYLFIFENISCIHQNQQFVVGVGTRTTKKLKLNVYYDVKYPLHK